jgi:hypothetical protein
MAVILYHQNTLNLLFPPIPEYLLSSYPYLLIYAHVKSYKTVVHTEPVP